MADRNLPAPILVTRQSALKQLADNLSRQKIIAVDTESNSLYAYREQVCLIQFSTPEMDYLVDPLVLKDLSPLAPVFSNPNIEKVFHAAEYDLICMKRDFDFHFANLFDTMVAARVLGREALGLGAMLEEEFGVHADKKHQRADWGQRPLPPYLLSYAQLDTHYLIALRDGLRAQLKARGLLPLAEEDFDRIRVVNGRASEGRPEECWRITGAYELSPRKAAVLHELCHYRDKIARNTNRPLFKVLNDSTLMAIAIDCPADLDELAQVPGMSQRQVERHGRAILSAVQRGLAAEPLEAPRSVRPSEQLLERLEALRKWRKYTAEAMGVKSDVVLPRDLLQVIAGENPKELADLEAILSEVPWRFEHFGEQILETLGKTRN